MLTDSKAPSSASPVIDRLLKPGAFPHEVTELEILETHISWVILTGPFAYKIKKPVEFDFVDYTTLDRRMVFCEREVQLNRRFAPDLYLGVVPIFESDGRLRVGDVARQTKEIGEPDGSPVQDCHDASHPVEYAVKMCQFPQEAIASSLLANDILSANEVWQLGCDVARFHSSIESAEPTLASAGADQILADAIGNSPILLAAFKNDSRHRLLKSLEQWTMEECQRLESSFSDRLNDKFVRRCHGDMHLKNIVRLDDRLIPFDGIEFNEAFQWIDVLSEIAFPVMDFAARGRPDLGWRMLNAWLESTGDYAGLPVLRFYLVYRAMVRAKVTWLNPKNKVVIAQEHAGPNPTTASQFTGPWDKYLDAAKYFAFNLKPSLSITHGFSGSGKSTIAMQLIDQEGGIRIRTDVERHRLARTLDDQDKYSPEMNDRVYASVLSLAQTAIHSGLPVFVDGTFLQRNRRESFQSLASKLKVPYRIIDCHAPFDELCQRIKNRYGDPSEATIDVLKLQMGSHEPLVEGERPFVIR